MVGEAEENVSQGLRCGWHPKGLGRTKGCPRLHPNFCLRSVLPYNYDNTGNLRDHPVWCFSMYCVCQERPAELEKKMHFPSLLLNNPIGQWEEGSEICTITSTAEIMIHIVCEAFFENSPDSNHFIL